MFSSATDWAVAQDAYHRHRWPDRPYLSVCMSRPEAKTVSYTVTEVQSEHVRLAYYPDSPDHVAEPTVVRLKTTALEDRSV